MGDWESTLAAPSVTDRRSRDNEQLAVATVYRSTDWTGTTLKEVSRQRCKHCPVPSEQPWRDPVEPVLRRYCRSAYQLRRNGGNPQAGHKAAVLIGWADRKGRGGWEVRLGGIMIGLGLGGPGATKSNRAKTVEDTALSVERHTERGREWRMAKAAVWVGYSAVGSRVVRGKET